MDTPKKQKLDQFEKFGLVILYIVLLIGLLFAFIGLSEFYNVRVIGSESAYAFGPVADNQWYYQNAEVYWAYNLVSGLLFLGTFIVSVWATVRGHRNILLLGAGMTVILLIVTFVSTSVQ
jgi:hypothetical protein